MEVPNSWLDLPWGWNMPGLCQTRSGLHAWQEEVAGFAAGGVGALVSPPRQVQNYSRADATARPFLSILSCQTVAGSGCRDRLAPLPCGQQSDVTITQHLQPASRKDSQHTGKTALG